MLVQEIMILIMACAGASAWLYRKWSEIGNNYKKSDDACVMRGDMYCSHTEWCDLEIEMYPEQYEKEMKRSENDKNQD